MNEAATVLVGLSNPRTAAQLVKTGIDLARARGGRLVVVSVVLVAAGQSLSTGARSARTQRRLLRVAAQSAKDAGIAAETLVRAGHAVDEALVDVVAEVDAGLLIVGWSPTPRYGQPRESAMWRLSQDPPCDLLSVRPYAGGEQVAPQRILLPVRGGQHADLAADLAVSLARLWGASVTILRIIPEYLPEQESREEGTAFRAYWEARYPGMVEARSIVARSVQDSILEEAAIHDLLMLGAAATSRSYPYPFGRLSEEVAERATCPVLIAKTERAMAVADIGNAYEPQPVPAAARAGEVSRVVDKWFAENTFHSKEFANIAELVRLKEAQGLTISLVLPTLNEEETLGTIIETIQEDLQRRYPLVDELIVVDSRSQDRTVAIARALGVPVHVHQDALPELGTYHGKGEALWKSLSMVKGDIIAWIDTDIVNIHSKFVYGILGPLLREPRIGYVKGFYRRPLRQGATLHESSGGRVTELMARPLINLFYPQLSGLIQPLSGEYAGRRHILESVPFQTGYGVEIGLLIDILNRYGLNSIAQVDLERRVHRNQSLAALSRMSFTILQTVLTRLERQQHIELVSEVNRTMKLIEQSRGGFHLDVRTVEEHERPPMAEVIKQPVGR